MFDKFDLMSYFELVDYCKSSGLDSAAAESWTEDRLMVWARSH